MWWSRRGVLVLLVALGGCGFTPAYGPDGAALALRGRIAVEAPATAQGYALRQRLLDRLGGPGADWLLALTLTQEAGASAIAPDGTTTRVRLLGGAEWRLTDGAGALLGQGAVDAFTAYSATGSTVASRTARLDAEERLSILLADRIVTQLLALAPDLP